MASVAIELRDEGFDQALNAIDGIETLPQHELLDAIGQLVKESTRHRIEVTKTAPDGSYWQKNRQGTSTLHQSGDLADLIDTSVSGGSVSIVSALVYSRIHQLGGVIKPKNKKQLAFMAGNKLVFATKVTIPARPYLGISPQDQTDILDMVRSRLSQAAQGLVI